MPWYIISSFYKQTFDNQTKFLEALPKKFTSTCLRAKYYIIHVNPYHICSGITYLSFYATLHMHIQYTIDK